MSESERADIGDEYRRLAIGWHDAQGNSAAANKLFDEHHLLYKAVRDRAEGRGAIVALMDDDHAAVRLLAATHTLAWQPDKAVATLRALEDGRGLLAVDAKYTLKSYLNGDVEPRLVAGPATLSVTFRPHRRPEARPSLGFRRRARRSRLGAARRREGVQAAA